MYGRKLIILYTLANVYVHQNILNFQQEFTAFKINEIIKGGSLGHGTAVFGDFDVDLVIYSDGKYHYLNKLHSENCPSSIRCEC